VNAASTLTHIRNSLFVPPMVNHYGTPTIEISEQQPHLFHSHHTDPPTSKHRLQVLKRLAEGVRAFIITPIGIIITIYGILVVFWVSRLTRYIANISYSTSDVRLAGSCTRLDPVRMAQNHSAREVQAMGRDLQPSPQRLIHNPSQ
jgi:hypothetical protein